MVLWAAVPKAAIYEDNNLPAVKDEITDAAAFGKGPGMCSVSHTERMDGSADRQLRFSVATSVALHNFTDLGIAGPRRCYDIRRSAQAIRWRDIGQAATRFHGRLPRGRPRRGGATPAWWPWVTAASADAVVCRYLLTFSARRRPSIGCSHTSAASSSDALVVPTPPACSMRATSRRRRSSTAASHSTLVLRRLNSKGRRLSGLRVTLICAWLLYINSVRYWRS